MLPRRLLALGFVLLGTAQLHAQTRSADGLDLEMGVKVPLRDGVKLNATLYFPQGPRTPRAVVLAMTPYMADRYHAYAIPIAKRGYVVAVVDVRGRGSSEGQFDPFAQEAKDGYDTIEWLAKQPWSNGKVGMIGGSYGGFNQWTIAKEFPPHLVSITPTAAAHLGIDFPSFGGIGVKYQMAWISFTSGQYTYASLFGDGGYWNSKYRAGYLAHVPFAKLDSVVGNPSPAFQRWLAHPSYDSYWAGMAPSPEQLARLSIPVLTRTGMYDGDQIGAMEHYRNHMKHGTPEAKARHYLMIGPWDHAGTRVPQKTFGGLTFSEKSVIEMEQLEADWFDWTMGNGPQPKLLPKRVAYYVTGAEEWKYADSLAEIGRNPTRYYLTSAGNAAASIYQSGGLSTSEPRASAPDQWTYDPLDTEPGKNEPAELDYAEQYSAINLDGRGVIYHTEPFEHDTEISGFPILTLWLTLDVPDSDVGVSLHEITKEGKSILLTDDALRLRYRESRTKPVLLTPGQATRVDFTRFRFMSRRIAAGSRIRLLIQSPNSIQLEKNYNSGGDVSRETAKDARTAHVKLHHEPGKWSTLHLPVVKPEQE
jgi:hypothetical protein